MYETRVNDGRIHRDFEKMQNRCMKLGQMLEIYIEIVKKQEIDA